MTPDDVTDAYLKVNIDGGYEVSKLYPGHYWDSKGRLQKAPDYANDITAAFRLVEAMRKRPRDVRILIDVETKQDEYVAQAYALSKHGTWDRAGNACDSTPAAAIRAAVAGLAARGVITENETAS